MYAASTAVRWSLRNTFDVATVITKSVSSSGGTSPSSRRQVTAGVLIGLMPPVDSRMPVIQLVRRTSPSVNTRIPAERWTAMFSAAARSSAARSSAFADRARLVLRPGGQQPGLPQQAPDVLSVNVRRLNARCHGRPSPPRG